uniref:Cytochrome c biogenesis protein CcsA n=1 Tax=Apophlaea sinclairii TaxID=212746 RepID=A0A1C9CBI4_9FLOR|nr:cytochrome c biogenesis protein [Apophlaea sinclairii]AOM65760.1 cytochrome c biogenesis protein [Apophlaea sinclairii]
MTLSYITYSLVNFVFVLTFITMLIYWSSIAFPSIRYLFAIAKVSMIVDCIFLGSIISYRWILNQYFPLSNLYESLLFLAWCIIFINIIIEKKINSRLVGSIITPLIVFILAFSDISLPNNMHEIVPLVPALQSNWLMMHVSVMILSYASLITGSLLSVLFLILTYNTKVTLKGSSVGLVLPDNSTNSNINKLSLVSQVTMSTKHFPQAQQDFNYNHNYYLNLAQSLDNLSYRIISLGFPLLTLGIIAGAVWANEAWGSYWSWDPKETWALITWLVFAGYLHTRFNKSWQGRKPAILASIGFLVIWICYLGVNFLGKGLHSYGWIS